MLVLVVDERSKEVVRAPLVMVLVRVAWSETTCRNSGPQKCGISQMLVVYFTQLKTLQPYKARLYGCYVFIHEQNSNYTHFLPSRLS